MTLLNGGPAFPATTHNDSDRNITDPFGAALPPDSSAVYPGMTLRDYFAVHADIGKVSIENIETAERFMGREIPADFEGQLRWQVEFSVRMRWMYADAMLKTRSQS